MKIKKESIILVAVIVALSAYLLTRQTDRTHYALPTISSLKSSELSKVEITKPDGTILLDKGDNDQWHISPEGYPADADKVDGLLEAIGHLTVTALISESGSYYRYELDDEKKIGIKAWKGGQVIREFDVGKPASSFQHTFIKLKGDPRVYHARGNFKSRFDQTVDGLRDKTVLSFDREKIHEITISSAGAVQTFIRSQTREADGQVEGTLPPSESKTETTVWKTPEGKIGDEADIRKILNTLSDLRCDQFIEAQKKEDLKDPTWTFQLKGAQEHRLVLFAKIENDNTYPAVSSQNDYPFLLPEWQVNQLTKKVETHAGDSEKATQEK
jgi:hypothetical protein